MKSSKLTLKFLAVVSTSLLFLNSAISANAECTTGLWSADWEVSLTNAHGGFETLADDNLNVYAMGASESSSPNGSIVVKYNKNGVELWRHTYNEPGNSQTSPIAFEFDNNGNINVLALAYSSSDAVTYSLTPDGVLRWGYAYSNLAFPIINPRDLATDSKGNSYVTGTISTSGTSNSKDIFLIKVNKNGVFQWAQQYDSPTNDGDFSVRVRIDKKGRIFVGGFTVSEGFNRNMLVLKYTAGGSLLWERTYDGSAGLSEQVTDMEVDSKGAVIVVGNTFSGRVLLKYNKNGKLIYENIVAGPYNSEHSLAIDSKKLAIVTSTLSSSDGIEIVKYDKKGSTEWTNTYTTRDAIERDVQVDDKKNIYILGQIIPAGSSDPAEAVVQVYDKNGALLYTDNYIFANRDIVVRNLALSCGGDFYFEAWDDFGANDVITVRYEACGNNKFVKKCNSGKISKAKR